MPPRPGFILFDLGNVLVRWDPARLYRPLIPDRAELQYFLDEICPMRWHLRHDLGEAMDVTIAERSREFPGHADLIRRWRDDWAGMFDGEVPGTRALLGQLKGEGARLFALTNLPAEKEAETFALFPGLRDLFEDVVVSGTERLAKPDPAIYRLTLARMGTHPANVFFTDDNAANIEAAAEMGFHTHRFVDAGGLANALRAAGWLTDR